MEAPAARAVVLVRIPFSDLSRAKLRPALVLAAVAHGDFLCCQITSKPYADPRAIMLADSDFASGGLARVSFVRPGKLFTAHRSLIERTVGWLKPEAHQRVLSAIVRLLQEG